MEYGKLLMIGIIMVLVDIIYLSSISNYFNKQILMIQQSPLKLNIYGAIICYITLVFGLYWFIIRERRTLLDAYLLGLVIYLVYETTNKAIITNWLWKTVLLDGLWGGILFSLTTYILYKIYDIEIKLL